MISGTRSRWGLLAGVSLLALGVEAGLPRPAAACISLASSATLFGSTSCVQWTGGNFSITNTGVISSATPSLYVSVSGNSLINSGHIIGSEVGLENVALSTITQLTNDASGTITAAHTAAIENAGSIGVLNNNGTISISGNPAIYNTGVIGSLGNANNALISGSYAIHNSSGSIGALSNSGTISGSSAGVYNDTGTIGTLTNSGTISGGNYGLDNTGSIDTLSITSGGLISGGTNGILNNGGTIATLVNAGTIQDNFVSGLYNVSNGSIGTLSITGSGLISGAVGLVNLGSTIGTLINDGRITGTYYGIYSLGGTLGALSNSGTISGSSGAIYIDSESSFGALTNSGIIAGGIENDSANALTINGGSGSIFGTLTGASGGIGSADRGTIVNTSSNLVFSSGNLLLNDNINAAGHTVINSGATLRLDNAIAITGAYSQTGGGLLITATDNGASYSYLAVSGNAAVSNSAITISGAGLSAGQSYTIVRSGGTGSYTNDSAAVAMTSGLAAIITTVDQDLVVTLLSGTSGGYRAKGLADSPAGGAIGGALDQIAAGTSSQAVAFQNNVLSVINALPASGQGTAIRQLAPTQNVPASQMATSAATAVLGAVEQHQETAMAYDPAPGAAAGSEEHASALWGQILGGGARRGSNAQADGYSLANFGLTTGVDHRFTPNAMAGVALSWVRAWSEGRAGSTGSSSILDSYQLTLYGTYRLDRAFVDGQAGVGWNHFNQKRAIPFLGTAAQADYDGRQYLAKATVGYDFPVTDGLTATPLASLRWLRAENDSYGESGAGDADLSIAGRGVNSVSQDLGGKLSWALATSLGTVKPEMRAAWVHDYTQGAVATSGLLGGQVFAVTTPRTAADGVRLGAAASLSGTGDVSFRVEYESELRHQYQSHTGLVKVIWGF